MVFSSPIFLFLFLPLVLVVYFISPKSFKNIILLIASLLFYAWGEPVYIGLMLISIVFNYFWALGLGKSLGKTKKRKKSALIFLIIGVAINLGLLFYFKYAVFAIAVLNKATIHLNISPIILSDIHLPVGISFFTFHTISYLVDIYRRLFKPQKNLFTLALYVSFFPQLIAGPIIRYHTIAAQLEKRQVTFDLFISGIKRFILGLGKKVLIANTVAVTVDKIFAIPLQDLTTPLIWLGVLCYTIQIYFDFSGYSDMAIGLGRMFGFDIPENFNYPYIAKSIQDFWRRWHISLSSWFRDYLYIPLGGNRVGDLRLYTNLFIVFILCGFWHGASWHFLAWGFYYGFFLALERWKLSAILENIWLPLQHLYALLIILMGWAIFRADNLQKGLYYLKSMYGLTPQGTNDMYFIQQYFTYDFLLALTAGILFSLPILAIIKKLFEKTAFPRPALIMTSYAFFEVIFLITVFFASIVVLASNSYNPFIYFRF